jgi:hypothetical protein
MSRQEIEHQLTEVREQERSSRVGAGVSLAMFASAVIVQAEYAANDIILKSGEYLTTTQELVLGSLDGVILALSVGLGLRIMSYSQKAAALEGVLAQDQLNMPDLAPAA